MVGCCFLLIENRALLIVGLKCRLDFDRASLLRADRIEGRVHLRLDVREIRLRRSDLLLARFDAAVDLSERALDRVDDALCVLNRRQLRRPTDLALVVAESRIGIRRRLLSAAEIGNRAGASRLPRAQIALSLGKIRVRDLLSARLERVHALIGLVGASLSIAVSGVELIFLRLNRAFDLRDARRDLRVHALLVALSTRSITFSRVHVALEARKLALAAARAGAERARAELTWDAAAALHLALYRELA